MIRRPPPSTRTYPPFPYTNLCRSRRLPRALSGEDDRGFDARGDPRRDVRLDRRAAGVGSGGARAARLFLYIRSRLSGDGTTEAACVPFVRLTLCFRPPAPYAAAGAEDTGTADPAHPYTGSRRILGHLP